MASTLFHNVPAYPIVTHTVVTTATLEEGQLIALDGTFSATAARGPITICREDSVTVGLLGKYPVKVADGQTIAIGDPIASNGSGEAVVASSTDYVVGFATDAVTAASGSYIQVAIGAYGGILA